MTPRDGSTGLPLLRRSRRATVPAAGKPPPAGRAPQDRAARAYGDFSWNAQRAAAVEALSYEQFTAYAHSFFSRENARRLAVLVEGVLTPENDFRYEKISREDVRNLGSFVTSR